MILLGKDIIYKGILRCTATTYWNSQSIAVKIDEPMEGIPPELVVYPEFMGSMSPGAGFKMMGKMKQLIAFNTRPGDKLVVEGSIVMESEKKTEREYVRMPCSHIYNETLRIGF